MPKIFTKRNALLGWLTWIVGKRVAKGKARGMLRRKKAA
jgi:hypothetical protein